MNCSNFPPSDFFFFAGTRQLGMVNIFVVRMKTISTSEWTRFCFGLDLIEIFLLFSFSLIFSFSGGQLGKMVMDTFSCCEWTGPASVFRIVVVE